MAVAVLERFEKRLSLGGCGAGEGKGLVFCVCVEKVVM